MISRITAVSAVVVLASIAACTTVNKVNKVNEGPGETPGEEDEDGGGASEADGGEPSDCPTVGANETTGTITAADVEETSGIVASSINKGVYWIHNDSGDTARVFAVREDGTLMATVSFDTAKPRDFEDIAIEDVSGESAFLYFADIGDNDAVRPSVTIHRVEEPKLGTAPGQTLTVTTEKMTVTYADGAHNAETLLFDPLAKELLIATKKLGGPSYIHRIGKFVAGSATTEKIATVNVDFATGGEISRDGKYIAVRNPTTTAAVWIRHEGESIADAMSASPCKFPIAKEPQGEAFAFLPDGSGYITVSEGNPTDLHKRLMQ